MVMDSDLDDLFQYLLRPIWVMDSVRKSIWPLLLQCFGKVLLWSSKLMNLGMHDVKQMGDFLSYNVYSYSIEKEQNKYNKC